MIDDVWAMVGSPNINYRSTTSDAEIAVWYMRVSLGSPKMREPPMHSTLCASRRSSVRAAVFLRSAQPVRGVAAG